MSLSKCLDISGNSRNLIVDQFLMDGLEMSISEEVVNTTKIRKKRPPKTPNSKFYNRLLECLDREEHSHMLRYVPNTNNREFEVIFKDKKDTKNWNEKDISLFKDLDKYLGTKFDRERPPSENDCKTRFRSNMCKCIRKKFVEIVDDTKIRSKTTKIYRILWRPVGQQSGNNREIAGSIGKSKKKWSKRTNKKEKKNIVPGYDDRYSEKSSTIVHFQEESRVQLKNELGESRNIIWDHLNDKIKSLQSFGKKDLSKNHYSCLLSYPQMDIDGNIDSTLASENLNWIDEMQIINVVPLYSSGVNTDVGVDTSFGNSDEEILNSSWEEDIINCELPCQNENLDFERNQPNAGMIYAYSNVDGYRNSGVQTEENQNGKNGQECLRDNVMDCGIINSDTFLCNAQNEIYVVSVDGYRNSGVQTEENQNGKNGQECLGDNVMDCGILKSDPVLCNAQNEIYDVLNSIGENNDFANTFIELGGAGALYPSLIEECAEN